MTTKADKRRKRKRKAKKDLYICLKARKPDRPYRWDETVPVPVPVQATLVIVPFRRPTLLSYLFDMRALHALE
jgi:hypothetical protein